MIDLSDMVRIGSVLCFATATGLIINKYDTPAMVCIVVGVGLSLYSAALERRR